MSDERTSDQALAADDLRSRAEELEASRGNRVDLADPAPAGFVEADAAEAARWRQNLDAFFNTIDDLLFVLDAAGTMIHVNETACRRLGYPAEELIGRPVLDVHPPDRRGEAGRMVAAMLAGSADVCTVPVVTKDGVEIPVETRVAAGVWDGGPAFFGVTKDMSAVKLSEEKFSRAFNSAPALMAISTLADGRFVDVNDTFLTTLGLSREEVVGRTSEELGLFVDPGQRRDAVRAAGQTSVRNLEVDVRGKDGTVTRGLFSADSIVLGDESCLLTTMLDLTERRQAEDALRKSEAVYRSLMNAFPDDVTVTDLEGRIRMVTPRAMKLFGYECEDDGLGRRLTDFLVPDDWERAQANIARIHEGGVSGSSEYLGLRADGSTFPIEVSSELIRDARDQPTGMVFVLRDITERRRAEEALQQSEALYRSILSASPENVTLTDLEGRIRLTSPAALTMFGYDSMDDAQGRVLIEFLVPEDRARARAHLELMYLGSAPAMGEYRGLRADGSTFALEVSAEIIRDADEQPTGLVFISRDISERKQAEERLRSTTTRLSGLLTSLPDLVFFKDRRGVYLGCNPEFARLVGRDPEAVVGATDGDLFGEETAGLFREQDEIMLAQGEPRHHDEWVEFPDGARALVDTLRAPLRDADGCVIGLLGVSRDITAREQGEQRLRESEEQLARAVEGSVAGLWDWNVPTGEVTFNERWAEISGYTLAELAPVSVDDWNDMWHPDDLCRSDALIERHFAGETPMYECEVRVRHKDGRWVWVLDRGKVSEWDDAGRPVRMVGTQLDVTARREAEDTVRERESYLSAIIENQPGLVWLKDTEGRFLAANNAFAAVAGWGHAEDIVGMTDLDIWPRERAEKYLRDDVRTLETRQPTVYEQALDIDGETRWMETFKAPVVDKDGRLLGTTGYAADITDRKQADERLRGANRQLEQAVAHANDLALEAQAATTAKARFLAHMSHEIRTPLNAIIGFAQLLQHDAELTAQQAGRVTIINRSGEHLLALLSDILELSKVEAKVQRLDRASFDLRELLEDLALVFGVRAGTRGLTFRTAGFDQVPRYITGDQLKLRQTLTNLLANAVKFTDGGGVVLSVSASQEEGAGRSRLIVLVEDTGAGIAADEMGALFAPFEQTTSGRASGQGTGLGLAISRQFAQIMDGGLSVTSVVGEGSVFRLEVPLEVGTADMTARSRARRVVRLEADQTPLSVLVVDDDADSRTLLLDMLGDVGFDVFAAGGGLEATEVFASRRPSLVLMDLWMPDVDGNEAVRRIRAQEDVAETKIIALTANFTDGVRSGALAAGADAFMAKPFRASALFEEIRALTGVRYAYAEATEPEAATVETPAALDREKIDALPADLKQQIRDAAVRARHARLLELALQVTAVDPETSAALKRVIGTFDYAAVLAALEERNT